MPRNKPTLNMIVDALVAIYNDFPTLINWSIAIGIIYVFSLLDIKP